MNDKAAVANALKDLGLYLQIKGENSFKTRAYDIASERIAGLADDLGQLVAENRLTELEGVGASIAAKITELVNTGKLEALETLKHEYPITMLELLKVPNLGPKKAKVLFDLLGVGSIADLEAACKAHRVRDLKGFGAQTEEKLLAGVELARRTGTGRSLLADVLPRAEKLLEHVKQAPGVKRASLGGSVRRMRETVADVDIIASAAEVQPVFEHFVKHPDVREIIGAGDSKASVRLREGDLQVDLRVLPDEDFATALHHFTGSKAHHIKLRSLAIDQGLKLSEWGVHRGDQKQRVRDEAELYAMLGMQYVPPELREDWGEIEAAREGRLPPRLVEARDIVGNIHSHTTWSDGRASLLEMAQAAKAMGLKYYTVTEHSQTSSYAGGLSLDKMKAQWDEIDAVNEQLEGITLLKGIESDILEDGSLDYPDAVLEKLDVVIGSIHQRYSQDEDAMTRRVLNAMENPHFQIWGHPTGRLINRREAAPMRMEEILDKAAQKGVAIEINGCPERLDLKAEHVRLALQRGLKVVVSTDAHSVGELHQHLPLALATARKGWTTAADVLNTRSAKDFVESLRRG
ncbi:MAG: DNA polymerase/3'-5' exonuclease PolX [Archangiaceae bacterium]|nr:DNA polymerase/3'-5' exonuclease PolX [Archangiaceae bacterium]